MRRVWQLRSTHCAMCAATLIASRMSCRTQTLSTSEQTSSSRMSHSAHPYGKDSTISAVLVDDQVGIRRARLAKSSSRSGNKGNKSRDSNDASTSNNSSVKKRSKSFAEDGIVFSDACPSDLINLATCTFRADGHNNSDGHSSTTAPSRLNESHSILSASPASSSTTPHHSRQQEDDLSGLRTNAVPSIDDDESENIFGHSKTSTNLHKNGFVSDHGARIPSRPHASMHHSHTDTNHLSGHLAQGGTVAERQDSMGFDHSTFYDDLTLASTGDINSPASCGDDLSSSRTSSATATPAAPHEEALLASVDMLCDDLYCCKTDVLRSFAGTRGVHARSKAECVLRLIELAHGDAHGESKDLSITRRVLGDVFHDSEMSHGNNNSSNHSGDNSSSNFCMNNSLRVSGLRSAWTNKSLEASHIEMACDRHLRFENMANSRKTLMVRRHAAETARVMRRLLRPFQEEYERTATAAVGGVFRHYRAEADALVHALPAVEVVSPFAALLVSYIRFGSSLNLLTRTNVNEKLVQLHVVQHVADDVVDDAVGGAMGHHSGSSGMNRSLSASASMKDANTSFSSSSASSSVLPYSPHNSLGAAYGGGSVSTLHQLMGLMDETVAQVEQRAACMHESAATSSLLSSSWGSSASMSGTQYGESSMAASSADGRQACAPNSGAPRCGNQSAENRARPSIGGGQVGRETGIGIARHAKAFSEVSHESWPVEQAPQWVHDLARMFTNWEAVVRSDVPALADVPRYFFDCILAGVVSLSVLQKIYGDVITPLDVATPVRGALKKALELHFTNDPEKATMVLRELIGYVHLGSTSTAAAADSSRAALSHCHMYSDGRPDDALSAPTANSASHRLGSSSASRSTSAAAAMDFRAGLLRGEFFAGVLSQMQGAFPESSSEGNYTVARRPTAHADPLASSSHPLSALSDGALPPGVSAAGFAGRYDAMLPHRPSSHTATMNPLHTERVVCVLREITATASRCTRSCGLLPLMVQLTEDLHLHFRFHRIFKKLTLAQRDTVRNRVTRSMVSTVEYFEKEFQVSPISVRAVAFLVIQLLHVALRGGLNSSSSSSSSSGYSNGSSRHDGRQPVMERLASVCQRMELDVVGLTEIEALSMRDIRVAFPPQLSYNSWLNESDTREKNVYSVLPSVAVKGSSNAAMLISQAPMMRALDAISRVPWRINKYMLHVQEAIVREGFGFGKIRPGFYPLHYYDLSRGSVTFRPHGNSSNTHDSCLSGGNESLTPPHHQRRRTTAPTGDLDEVDHDERRDGWVGGEGDLASSSSSAATAAAAASDTQHLFNIRQRMQYNNQQIDDWKQLSELRSSRIHYLQALRQARSLVQFSHLYFPNSMDFRGRMYPVPGRLNHTGSDPFRALLEYAEPKPLGQVGLYWLKVHLANKMGMSKLSFDERVHYVDEHIHDVVQSAEAPLHGDRWWQEASEPLQCLMACKELADALRCSQGVHHFLSRLPVAVDGSYNGLQHYSAMGRDAFGAALVNLVPSERPADAYTGILNEMMRSIRADAARDSPVAQRCLGSGRGQDCDHIKRKTIKRPIMTQVYGVTAYGMSEQILDELAKQNKSHGLWTLTDMREMAAYLREKVLESLGVTFRETQNCRRWIREVSQMVWLAQPPELRHALCWTTPLGLVVRQPYKVRKECALFTSHGYARIPGDSVAPASRKQLSAMAPNLIHSLDATHLAMTALEMQRQGKSMMAVHDSYWTYACDLPVLSQVLREQFVALYTHYDPLWELKEQWEHMFFHDLRRHGIRLPDPPQRGDLDLKVVLQSKYFFS